MNNKGIVFNIQHFSIHDGPGIRTVVFLKGCPLRCRWCANPESQKPYPELGWSKGECIGCKSCINALKELQCRFDEGKGIVWNNEVHLDEEAAVQVRRLCPSEALHVIGENKSVEEILEQVEKDMAFYKTSGGGMTISGGEPLMQPEFTLNLLREAKKRNVHTCIETSGLAAWEKFRPILETLDYLIMDIKCISSEKHKEQTGIGNEIILENLYKIRNDFPDLSIKIRTPVIPDFNDSEEELLQIAALTRKLKCEYELLKYHKLGEPKYEMLHRPYLMGDAELDDERYKELKKLLTLETIGAIIHFNT